MGWLRTIKGNIMEHSTEIKIFERKNGHASDSKVYEITVGKYIEIVKDSDSNGELALFREVDEDEFIDDFWALPTQEQLERCIEREKNSYAMSVCYEVI